MHLKLNYTVSDIICSIEPAKSLFPSSWLKRQWRKTTQDILLLTHERAVSREYVIDCVSRDIHRGTIHPLAEAVLVAEEIKRQYEKDGRVCKSNALYKLFALAKVGNARSKIAGIENRVDRLKIDDWRGVLYEMLVAAEYSEFCEVRIVEEGTKPAPDLELRLKSGQLIYVECKAKHQFDEAMSSFVKEWRNKALGEISSIISKFQDAFVVRVSVKSNSAIERVPDNVYDMVIKGKKDRTIKDARIHIDCFQADEQGVRVPRDMSMLSQEFWKWVVCFDEWQDWHYILPGGEYKFKNLSNAIVSRVKRPTLICIRAEHIVDERKDVLTSLKDACRRQLRDYEPGIVRILLPMWAFGGRQQTNAAINQFVQSVSAQIFGDYSRLVRIVYDVVRPPFLLDKPVQISMKTADRNDSNIAKDVPITKPILLT